LEQVLQQRLNERQRQSLYRVRKTIASAQGASVVVDGKQLLGFCSNDYLGLANHPEINQAAKQAIDKYGIGSGASHLVCGHSSEHHALEQELAEFTGRDRALLFSTGYMANLGVITALLNKSDYLFEDKLNHASLLDGGLLSGARMQRYLHNDITSLELKLAKTKSGNKLIAVDGVFSMDGDIAPLPELVASARRNEAWLMVDDAHGFGVLGKNGGGCSEHFGLDQQQLPILMATLGKGLGTFGAFVAGSNALIETLIQFSKSYIYTTAMPPSIAASTRAGLRLLQTESWRREHLVELINYFKHGAALLELPLMESNTAIQPLLIGDANAALALSAGLEAKGIWVSAIRPPTVPAGSARLRITLSAVHSKQQVEQLLQALAELMPRVNHEQ
jgi:8-amino-7-oxononanoate synthase|tara:strand:+ start:9707 stop:10879 length:1173 start_codon:yes stop_codon:yes gene_type:complete